MSSASPSNGSPKERISKAEYNTLMQLDDWEYSDLLRYGRYHIVRFAANSNYNGPTNFNEDMAGSKHLHQLQEIADHFYTSASTKNPNSTHCGLRSAPKYLNLYMLKDDADKFFEVMGKTLADEGCYIARKVKTGESVIDEIGTDAFDTTLIRNKGGYHAMVLGEFPLQRDMLCQLPEEVRPKLQDLLNKKNNMLVFVQILQKRHTRNRINERVIEFVDMFRNGVEQWGFQKLLSFGRYNLRKFEDDSDDGGSTGIEPHMAGKWAAIMKRLNQYMFTTYSADCPDNENTRLSVQAFMPLSVASQLCKFLHTHKINYILRLVKDKVPTEQYLHSDVWADYANDAHKKKLLENKGITYMDQFKDWIDGLGLPDLILPQLDQFIKHENDPLTCVHIEHNSLKKDLYEILLEYFNSAE